MKGLTTLKWWWLFKVKAVLLGYDHQMKQAPVAT